MDNKSRVVVNLFDKHSFEKFTTIDPNTGVILVTYKIDGVTFEQKEWARRQEEAITRDLTTLGLRSAVPQLSD